MIDAGEPVLPHVATTRYTAEQWKSRALYEEACKLNAQRALQRTMDMLREALFAAAHVPSDPVDGPVDEPADRHLRPVGSSQGGPS